MSRVSQDMSGMSISLMTLDLSITSLCQGAGTVEEPLRYMVQNCFCMAQIDAPQNTENSLCSGVSFILLSNSRVRREQIRQDKMLGKQLDRDQDKEVILHKRHIVNYRSGIKSFICKSQAVLGKFLQLLNKYYLYHFCAFVTWPSSVKGAFKQLKSCTPNVKIGNET